MTRPIYYFAYGSNMHPYRFAQRIPAARLLETAVLDHHELLFHKRGRDGSGKCNIYPNTGHQVFGVVYVVGRADRKTLGRIEGAGYRAVSIGVLGLKSARRYRVFAYQALAAWITGTDLLPYGWYRSLVVEGAVENDLPSIYVARLREVSVQADRNPQRSRRNQRLLNRFLRTRARTASIARRRIQGTVS